MKHVVVWDGDRWQCSCDENIPTDAEARRHYELDLNRRATEQEHLQVVEDDHE